jgi:hypothetical protein
MEIYSKTKTKSLKLVVGFAKKNTDLLTYTVVESCRQIEQMKEIYMK